MRRIQNPSFHTVIRPLPIAMKKFACEHCDTKFSRNDAKKRHQEGFCKVMERRDKKDMSSSDTCTHCKKTFVRKDMFRRHIATCKRHETKMQVQNVDVIANKRKYATDDAVSVNYKTVLRDRCAVCNIAVQNLHTHIRSNEHKDKICHWVDDNIEVIKTSFKCRIASYRIYSSSENLTVEDFLRDVKERTLKQIMCKQTQLDCAIKVHFELFASFVKQTKDIDEEIRDNKSFNTRNQTIQLNDNLDDIYESFHCEIKTKADEFQERDSGWSIERALYLELNINKYSLFKGSSCISTSGMRPTTEHESVPQLEKHRTSSYISLPKWIEHKHAVINVKNRDYACFAWAIVSALYPTDKNANRVTSYPHYTDVLNVPGIDFPTSLKDIKRFEKLNNISVNVFEVDKDVISGPLYHTTRKCDKHINLLLIESGEHSHFCWIKDMSRLVRSQMTKKEAKIYICDGCLLPFHNENKYLEHCKQDCSKKRTYMPLLHDNKLVFKKSQAQMRAPVVVYADFECILLPINTCSPSNSTSYTSDHQLHEAHSFGYYIKCSYDDTLSKYTSYRGASCALKFFQMLENDLRPFVEKINGPAIPMIPLTKKQSYEFLTTSECSICGKELSIDRVRDHCHLTGQYRGAAHSNCNLNYKINKFIPIVIHNLSKYDAHFIVSNLGDYDVKVLPKNKESFISLTIKSSALKTQLRFIDSYRFMPSGLDKLCANLDSSQFENIQKCFPPEKIHLVVKKGVFPYDYVDSLEKLNELSLPPRNDFYNTLNNTPISEIEYNHAQNVWQMFEIKTLGEYSDLYLKTDVLLLADIFENFRNICLKTYKLDPAHYYTAPGLSWDAMLKHTRVEIELLTDISMHKFISRGIRGGLSQCSGKYSKANNKYMKDYDVEKKSKYIMYLDANNQYGWAMSQKLPLKDFRWLTEMEFEKLNLTELSADDEKGYFLEVDLQYPQHLHDMHNDLPFCPEQRLPDFSKSKIPKLIADLNEKNNYVIHYMNLKQALGAGLKLVKIHRVIEFTQSKWLAPYIDLNTQLRTRCTNSFEKDFYKLMNNSVFGKTMENVDNRVDVRLVNRWESDGKRMGARALISKLNFHSCVIINENLNIIQMNQTYVKYNKPIHIGFAVLEISKTLMYDFHYQYMIPKYGNDVNLLYTDTDSFVYEIRTSDFYTDIVPDIEDKFDTSDYPENNVFNLPLVNKKVIGKFKDECANAMIIEFIGIRSKCYCIRKEDDKPIKKIKGIKRSVVSNEISELHYLDCLNKNTVLYRQMNIIQSKLHKVYTQTLNKKALSNSDDKRFIKPDNRHRTLAWGHRDIEKYYFI